MNFGAYLSRIASVELLAGNQPFFFQDCSYAPAPLAG
jgi:hypothetical protein